MEYGVSEDGSSAAYPKKIMRTLKNFGYSDGGVLKDYDTETVVAELKNGHCVLPGGCSYKQERSFIGIKVSPEYSGGHRWLCHGLLERRRKIKMYIDDTYQGYTIESEWYPLCNWGWDGYYDGYYLSGVFDTTKDIPYSSDTKSEQAKEGEEGNYQFEINVVTGIRR